MKWQKKSPGDVRHYSRAHFLMLCDIIHVFNVMLRIATLNTFLM